MFRTTIRIAAFLGCVLALAVPAHAQPDDGLATLERDAKKAGLLRGIVNANGKVTINADLTPKKVDQVVSIVVVHLNINDEDMETIATFPHLRILDLQGTEVTDNGVAHIGEMKTLRRLALRGTRVGNATLQHIQGLTGLEMVSVGHSRVTDEGLSFLKGFKDLRVLDLENTAVTDKGLESLTGLKNLKVLYLDQTRVTEKGVATLARALPETKIVWQGGANQQPAPAPRETAEQRRQRLMAERDSLEQSIAGADQQIASYLAIASQAEADAREAARDMRGTSAVAFQATARQARMEAQKVRDDVRRVRDRIRAIDAEPRR